jgi:opacity protein-like surface antigen
MRKMLIMAATAAFVLAAAPQRADAQTFITPFAGVTFGEDAPNQQFTGGASVTFMGTVAGFEVDFGYTPDFYDKSGSAVLIGSNNVTTLTGNLVIGVGEGPVRPYVVGGVGLVRSHVDGGDLFDDVSANDFGLDAGAGLTVMLSEHVGLRGDVRYFRSLQDPPGGAVDLQLGKFDFWRGTGGVAFKF